MLPVDGHLPIKSHIIMSHDVSRLKFDIRHQWRIIAYNISFHGG
jgi:hypothetical protein